MIHISSIPSPNFLAERSSDNVVENIDEFVDNEGNEFLVVIFSSITGIDWSMEQYPEDMEIIVRTCTMLLDSMSTEYYAHLRQSIEVAEASAVMIHLMECDAGLMASVASATKFRKLI